MQKIRIAIVGYGNVGRGVEKAIANNQDMELAAVASRSPERVAKTVKNVPVVDIKDIADWSKELNIDVAILCGGSKSDLQQQAPEVIRHLPTIDSFDNHSQIPQYFATMDQAAKAAGKCAIISLGWDPGIFSLERVLANTFLPGAKAYGFYGVTPKGGLSMGHSDALRTIEGIQDARQYTHAVPEAIEAVRAGKNPVYTAGEMHTRECFVVLKDGADRAKIETTIKTMPGYFAPYQTTIHFVSQAELDAQCQGFPHDGCVVASSVTGDGKNQALVEYHCRWDSNPEATAQVLVAHARALVKFQTEKRSGAFTILDVPASYLSPHSREELLKHWM